MRAGCRVPGIAPEGRQPILNAPPGTEGTGRYAHALVGVAAFGPEGRLILARDVSPWKALEKECVPSGRLKRGPGGSNPASGPPVTGRGDRFPTPKGSLPLKPAWPGIPFQASRRDAIPFKCSTQGLKSLAKIGRPSGAAPDTRHPAQDTRHPC